MPPFTIVHIITKLELGGAQENTLLTCEHLDKSRFRVVLLYGPGGYFDRRLPSYSFKAVPVPALAREIRPHRDVWAWAQLRRAIEEEYRGHRRCGLRDGAFVVHTHSSKAGLLGRAAASVAGISSVVHSIHGFGFHDGQNPLVRATYIQAERMAAAGTSAFVSVSHSNLEEARRLGIVTDRHRGIVVRSGMDLEPFLNAPSKEMARAVLRLPQEADIVVSVANLKPQKDPLNLIEAFARLKARRPHAILLYAGDGPLRGAAEALIARRGYQDSIRLLGWREDIPRLMAAADVVALGSRFEGLPRTAVQAAACGRTFVGTDVNGTGEIVRHGVNGLLVPPGDSGALGEALELGLGRPLVDFDREAWVRDWGVAQMVAGQAALYSLF